MYTKLILPNWFEILGMREEQRYNPVMEWSKTFRGSGWDRGYSVCRKNNGGYILVGFTGSFGVDNDDVYLIKTNWSACMSQKLTIQV